MATTVEARAANAAYMREYNRKNAERVNARKRASYRRHRAAVLAKQREYNARPDVRARMAEYNRAYQAGNRADVAQQRAEYRARNREAIRLADREHHARLRTTKLPKMRSAYRANPQATIDRNREWRRRNPDKVLAKNQRRRARKAGAHVEDVVSAVVFERDRGLCGICSQVIARKDFTIDHIIPLSRGGEHSYQNVQAAHRRCNSSKGTAVMAA